MNMKRNDVLMNIVRDEISQLVLTRSKEIVIMRIELVNLIVDEEKMSVTRNEYHEYQSLLFKKYNKHLYQLKDDDLLTTEEKNKLKMLMHVLNTRSRIEYRIDKVMKELNFSSEVVSMLKVYKLQLN